MAHGAAAARSVGPHAVELVERRLEDVEEHPADGGRDDDEQEEAPVVVGGGRGGDDADTARPPFFLNAAGTLRSETPLPLVDGGGADRATILAGLSMAIVAMVAMEATSLLAALSREQRWQWLLQEERRCARDDAWRAR